ncbi:lipid A deacylase LpxR family protein [Kangiella geojedonensis]|uniref:Lipid A deacylase LpxR family protein n=1 Tax=Kangiella geojedonensis TaxID=914150 RepID=A0A0F6RC26_9GAMM|nr:lipid A deacylase LpxR family protein [Kangiella geojedonensis]AKE52053.1 hypothetical protein TQ33_1093 [Kangiella geojedonensis]
MYSQVAYLLLSAGVIIMSLAPLDASALNPKFSEIEGLPLDSSGNEKEVTGWAIHFDNDLLVPSSGRDQDYTGGLGVELAGRKAATGWWSIDPLLGQLDNTFGYDSNVQDEFFTLHSAQFGLIVFSPSEIGNNGTIYDDRPFANLLHVSNTRRYISEAEAPVYQSTLTLGVLGTKLGSSIQKGIHKATGSESPTGWDHQISDGGEPTFKYSLSRQSLLASDFNASRNTEYEIKYSASASVGYITEASVALSGRWGLINTPWWSFTPENSDYNSLPAPVIGNSVRDNISEFYVSGGVKLRARAYNSFLQGQFRHSDVTFSGSELEHLIGEAWVGVTKQVENYRVSYVVRYQTNEIKDGVGSRNSLWAGVTVSIDY